MPKTGERESILKDVREEIEAVHRFIAAWFRGDGADSTEVFASELAARLAPEFVNIQPAGRMLTREVILAQIEKGFGANPRFDIEIGDVEIRHVWEGEGLVLATYTETQHGARNTTPPQNVRVSTVLLERDNERAPFTWLHIHETAVPDQQ